MQDLIIVFQELVPQFGHISRRRLGRGDIGIGSLFFGGNIFDAAEALAQMGADAVGVNCSTGPDKLEPVIRNIKERVDVPVLAKPNAGMPVITDTGEAVYSMGPGQFAAYMGTLVEAGAGIIGGCCGTTPEYIRKVTELCGRRN